MSLPSELLSHTHEYLDGRDLKVLRFVNSYVASDASQQLFKHESFMLSAAGDLAILRPKLSDTPEQSTSYFKKSAVLEQVKSCYPASRPCSET